VFAYDVHAASQFETTDAGASHTAGNEAGQIRVGGYVMLKGHPCKLADVSTSKTGKHGHAKCNMMGYDIFTGKRHEEIIQSTHTAQVPFVTRKDYTLTDINEGFVTLFDEETSECREDVKLPDAPEGFAREIQNKFTEAEASGKVLIVSVLSAMGHEQIIAIKEDAVKEA